MVAGVGMLQGRRCLALPSVQRHLLQGLAKWGRQGQPGATGGSCPPKPGGSRAQGTLVLFRLLFIVSCTHFSLASQVWVVGYEPQSTHRSLLLVPPGRKPKRQRRATPSTSCRLCVWCWKGTAMHNGYWVTLGVIWSEFLHLSHCLPHLSNDKFLISLTVCHQVSTQSLRQPAPNILLFHLSHQHPDLQVHTQLGQPLCLYRFSLHNMEIKYLWPAEAVKDFYMEIV